MMSIERVIKYGEICVDCPSPGRGKLETGESCVGPNFIYVSQTAIAYCGRKGLELGAGMSPPDSTIFKRALDKLEGSE